MERKMLLFSRKNVRFSRKTLRAPNAEASDMTSVNEARFYLEALLGPVPPGTPLKAMFPALARRLGVTVRRIETLWQGTARRIDAVEMDRLRVLAAARSQQSCEAAHADRYEAIATALEAVDSHLHGAEIARYRALACSLRGAAHHRTVAP